MGRDVCVLRTLAESRLKMQACLLRDWPVEGGSSKLSAIELGFGSIYQCEVLWKTGFMSPKDHAAKQQAMCE